MDNILLRLRFLLSLAIPLCYVIMGVYVMVEKIFIVKLKPLVAYSLGVVFVLYGVYRLYRAFGILKENKSK